MIRRNTNARGFTMIELTTVVLIILLLIAIALPNFLEAQIRARVTVATAEMGSLAQALEEYYLMYRAYPPNRMEKLESGGLSGDASLELGPKGSFHSERGKALIALTTPIALMSFLPEDPFPPDRPEWNHYDFVNAVDLRGSLVSLSPFNRPGNAAYMLVSVGPDYLPHFKAAELPLTGLEYSPTNGTRSRGDIHLFGP